MASVPTGAWQSQQEMRKPQLVVWLMTPPVLAVASEFHGASMRELLTYELFCRPRIGWYEALLVAKLAAWLVTQPSVPAAQAVRPFAPA